MKRLLMLCLALMLGLATSASAAQLTIQGHLANGGTSTDGEHTMIFTFYNDSLNGSVLWTETRTVTVQSLLFTCVLGLAHSIPDSLFGATAWLETSVDGIILAPRIGYYPQPINIGSGVWQGDGTNVWRTDGMVGIGVTPSASLTIDALTGGSSGRARLFYDSSIYPGIYGEIYHNGDQSGLTLQSRGSDIGSGDISFWTGQTTPVERMRVHHDGGVSIPNTLTTGTLSTTSLNASTLVANAIGVGPGAPWATTPGIYMDAGFQQSYLRWDNRASCGFLMYQPQGSNQFNFNSTGGGSWETWRWVSAGLGELFVIGPTITSNRSVQINGDLNVTGALNVTGPKCRVVKTDKYGDLYFNAVESAEAIFTTQGEDRLKNGKCEVELDRKWLAGVKIDGQHPLTVWITFYGPHGDYYVERGKNGFKLIDSGGSDAEFSWKVEARQAGYEDLYLNQLPSSAK